MISYANCYRKLFISDSGIESGHDKRTPEPNISTPVFNEALLTCMDYESNPLPLDEMNKKMRKSKKVSQSNISKKEVDNILDNASLKTMDGCLKILAQLNVREVMQESEWVNGLFSVWAAMLVEQK